jgi:hypothetical protein|tara:strand:+ start:30 stop:197 length:168 start_codon:yes stop_codon:yes gene_type:complete
MSIVSKLIKKQVKKKGGLAGILIWVGDIAVKATPDVKDDLLWNKVKAILKKSMDK